MRLQCLALARRLVPVAALTLLAAGCVGAAERTPIPAVNAEGGLAVKGYDPVAYFTSGKPTPGADRFTADWEGARYRFASAENRDRFVAAPATYAPQYGGYCAYAISINRIADIDPDEWAVVDGKLYLNNNAAAQALWSIDRRASIAAGDGYWAAVPKVSLLATR
jgi:YHS domain-containing protein